MALCNIVGDLGYLGYAFAAQGFVSLPKLIGALFTMLAHIFLLAYGDEQAQSIAAEKGKLSHIILGLRLKAQQLVACLPPFVGDWCRAKPIGVPFSMLAVNGLGLLLDAWFRLEQSSSLAMLDQFILGALIVLGTAGFAFADFVKGQKRADFLTKMAPSILVCASFANIGLAITTENPFVIISVFAFLLSNFAGFFTKIDKEKGQHLHS